MATMPFLCQPKSFLWPEHVSHQVTPSDIFKYRHVPPAATFFWRLAVTVYFIVWFFMGFDLAPSALYFCFLTNWGWTLSLAYFAFATVHNWYVWREEMGERRIGSEGDSALLLEQSQARLRLHKTITLLFEIALPLEIVIASLFWLVVWPVLHEEHILDHGFPLYINLNLHAVGLGLLAIEFLQHQIPFFSRHLIVSLLLGAVYCPINAGATFLTGKPLYPVLTWQDWNSAILVVVAFLAQTVFHFLCQGIRLTCCRRRTAIEPSMASQLPLHQPASLVAEPASGEETSASDHEGRGVTVAVKAGA
mmetsp:Transcript_10474/g.25342  ORF Transcript_10474/g.25342 Transcript_10474/m.25342 type:complete len:306 (+) Transcript_10474:166-1083(+)